MFTLSYQGTTVRITKPSIITIDDNGVKVEVNHALPGRMPLSVRDEAMAIALGEGLDVMLNALPKKQGKPADPKSLRQRVFAEVRDMLSGGQVIKVKDIHRTMLDKYQAEGASGNIYQYVAHILRAEAERVGDGTLVRLAKS